MKPTTSIEHDRRVNEFARFFGAILVDLKHHYERQRREQNERSRPYGESRVDLITYTR